MANISAEVQIWNVLKERLIKEFDLNQDDDVIYDTLTGERPLTDIIVQLARDAKQSEAYAEGLKSIIADNQARKKRLEERADKLRDLAAWAMSEIGLTKLQEADMMISRRQGKPAVVMDVSGPPCAPYIYTKQKITYSWDMEVLREAIEAGHKEAKAIAHISNPRPIITIRTK